ncbi:hypothetical protein ABZ819_23440 [Streptomyces venezuelae]|uniref:hypothetical protein n=1 Tax=Streptomyces venezuelae TaxID=54571 RepID=UPI00343DC7F3
MKRSGPLLTLLTGLLLALFMLSLNATTETGASSYGEDAPAPDASASSPTGSPSAGSSAEPTRTPAAKAPAKVPAKAEYAGRTDDGTSAVSISVRDGKAIAYYCDGRDTESWLKGNVEEDGSMRLTGKHGAKADGPAPRPLAEEKITVTGNSITLG